MPYMAHVQGGALVGESFQESMMVWKPAGPPMVLQGTGEQTGLRRGLDTPPLHPAIPPIQKMLVRDAV